VLWIAAVRRSQSQVDSLGRTLPDPNGYRFVEGLLIEIERLGEGISGIK